MINILTQNGVKTTEMPANWPKVTDDRKDDPFVYAACDGNAEYIITKDKKHFKKLGRAYRGIIIGTPKEFFDWAKITHPLGQERENLGGYC